MDKPCVYREGAGLQLGPESPGQWQGHGGEEQVEGDRNQSELKFQNKTVKLLLSPGVWI